MKCSKGKKKIGKNQTLKHRAATFEENQGCSSSSSQVCSVSPDLCPWRFGGDKGRGSSAGHGSVGPQEDRTAAVGAVAEPGWHPQRGALPSPGDIQTRRTSRNPHRGLFPRGWQHHVAQQRLDGLVALENTPRTSPGCPSDPSPP